MELIQTECSGTTRLSVDVIHLCPVVAEVDHVTVEITYPVEGIALELHSLAEFLREFATRKLSHEDLAYEVRVRLLQELGEAAAVTVAVCFHTAGITGEFVTP